MFNRAALYLPRAVVSTGNGRQSQGTFMNSLLVVHNEFVNSLLVVHGTRIEFLASVHIVYIESLARGA